MSAPTPTPSVALVIRFDPATGSVNVEGPLDQRLFCYGLLEMAREIILKRASNPSDHAILKAKSPILVPQLHFRGPLKG